MRRFQAVKFVFCLAILSIPIRAEATGCPEPNSMDGGRFEFGAGFRPGDDGRYPEWSLATVVCLEGYTQEGATTYIFCRNDGQWSEHDVTCQPRGCPKPEVPFNGKIRPRNGPRRVGSSITITCKKGFTRSGPRKKYCSKTPRGIRWKGETTTCLARNTCPTPSDLHGANWTLAVSDKRSQHDDESFSPNTKIDVACWPGFAMIGESRISCKIMSGQWKPSVPTCHEVRCPPLMDFEAHIPHLHSNMMNKTYRQGEVVDYFCDEGFQIRGKTWRICLGPSSDSHDQTWSDLDPVCSEILCPDPGSIQYGDRYLVSRHVGGSVTFSCRSGYQLQGSAVRHCLPTGKWSGQLTTCDHPDFYCSNPGIPIGGRMVNMVEARFQKRETVTYECYGDTVLVGSEERECTESHTWTGEAPTCQGRFDFDDPVDIARRMGYYAESLALEISTFPISGNRRRPKGRTIDLGYTGGMDIYFVFDASGSIPKAHFNQSLELAKALVKEIDVANGPRHARYATCVYASRAVPMLHVGDPQPSVEVVNAQIDAIADLHGNKTLGRGTATGVALKLVHTDLIPQSYRPEARKILFLFTDGKANMGGSISTPKEAAEILRNEYGVKIHCIGVGPDIDRSELQEIASRPTNEHAFFIEDSYHLSSLVKTLTSQKPDYSRCGFNGGPTHVKGPSGRIVGGDVAKDGQWPWMVALFCTKGVECDRCVPDFFCGGSLIARNWVLTAAHCLKTCNQANGRSGEKCCDTENIRVYTGILDKSRDSLLRFDPSLVYSIDGEDGLIKHEDFDDVDLDNDIALLRLERSARLSPRVRTICIPQPDMKVRKLYSQTGEPPFVAGWGATEAFDLTARCHIPKNLIFERSHVLKQLAVPMRSDEECRQSIMDHSNCYIVPSYKPDMAFCAGYDQADLDSCKGDSGGPVMREITLADGSKRWVQIGIVSWGEGCAIEGRYGIYTRLKSYTTWIRDHVGDDVFDIGD